MLSLPLKTDKPWGYELLWALTPFYAGKILCINKGHRLSLQYHKEKDETLYVMEGIARITKERTDTIVNKDSQPVRFKAREVHRIEALTDVVIIEVSTPEVNDVCRLEDDYNRVAV